jgi:hypothetical protein
MSLEDPAELLTEQFPITPYNFGVPPIAYPTIGPIKAILSTYQSLILAFMAVVVSYISQTTVQTATGPYLDALGVLYGVLRYPGELDAAYRTRIFAAISRGRNTLAAIQAAVQDYENGLSIPTGGSPVTAMAYDQQSNPTLCAADAAAGTPVPIFYFVVQLSSSVNVDDAAFADYCACDDEAYLYQGGTSYISAASADPALIATVTSVRVANTIPIFKNAVNWDTSVDPTAEAPISG